MITVSHNGNYNFNDYKEILHTKSLKNVSNKNVSVTKGARFGTLATPLGIICCVLLYCID